MADATANRVYAIQGSDVVSAFLEFVAAKPSNPTTPTNKPPAGDGSRCSATLRSGNNPWWAGFDVASSGSVLTLDFSSTGLDLNTVSIDAGGADVSVSGQKLTMTVPQWVSLVSPVYLGLGGSNNAALASLSAPSCTTTLPTAQ